MDKNFVGVPDVNNEESISDCGELIKILIKNHIITNVRNDITDIEDVIELLLKKYKSRKYIGVGVGGLCIKCIKKDKEYALLYKRYKEPEANMFSIIGGSGSLFQNIEHTLINKFEFFLGAQYNEVVVKDVLCVNNHMKNDEYHYLSPSYCVDIKNIDSYLYWDISKKDSSKYKTNNQKKVEVITTFKELKTVHLIESTKEEPLLAWVSLELIGQNTYSKYFSFTTRQAVEKYMHTKKKKSEILDKIKCIIDDKNIE